MKRFLFNLKATNAHGLHSPFVYELYTKIINPCLHQSGDLSTLLLEDLSNYQAKSLEKYKFKALIIDINRLDYEKLKMDFKDVVLIKNIRNSIGLAHWRQLIKNKKIIFSIELFEIGLLFFNPIAPKQHFIFKKS